MRRRSFLAIDWYILLPAFFLSIVGLTTLFAIDLAFFRSQLFFVGLGLLAFVIFSRVDYQMFSFLQKPLYFGSLVLLVLVLLVGYESRGAVRWIDIFGIRIQLSELIKPFLTLSLAGYLAGSGKTLRTFALSSLFLLPIAMLIALQPDLGSAVIFCLVFMCTVFAYGIPLRWFVVSSLPLLLLSPVLWSRLHEYQKLRILAFLHPGSDPQGITYNVMQAIIAVGSGTIVGRGLSESTQSSLQFLPERHTDFIFATISEGFGFVGAIVVIGCFVALLYRLYVVATDIDDMMGKLYLLGAFFFLLIQCFVNLGMNIGVLPVVGVTLPFVSYGGSSIIASFILLGIASSIATTRKETVLEIR